MSSPLDRSIKIEVTIRASQPEILEGLDVWLGLGLLSDAQVKQLCRSLTCPIPQPITTTPPQVRLRRSRDVQLVATPSQSSPPPIVRGMQSLMTELSVRWLLFLGVFMVVVSSGVLAATQWQKFPPSGQYGVLLGYTLIFWGISFWAGKQPNLQLTAQTLQLVTLLLVPVNFWAMDSFGLWHYFGDWLTVAIATLTLTGITVWLLKNRLLVSSRRLTKLEWLPILNILGLSYLHWGWRLQEYAGLPKTPLIAVYLGTIGTCLIAFYQTQYQQQASSRHQSPLSFQTAVVVYALVVLLVRAIFVVHVEVSQLGLAIGICGWLLIRLSLQVGSWKSQVASQPAPLQVGSWKSQVASQLDLSAFPPWESIGITLLLTGWLVSVGTDLPWQATAVSGLGLWVCTQRLQRFWHRGDLAVLLGIGLQTIWLGWRLVPSPVQTWAIATGTQLTGAQQVSWALLSLALFPYLILMVWLSDLLYRSFRTALANFGEQLAFSFGVVLTLLGLVNPTLRSLNLLFSTVTLAIVTSHRSPIRVDLVYLTHIIGVLTLGSTINWLYPNLSREVWASILLVVMVAEWGFSLGNGAAIWRRSAWHVGLGLAALSYSCLQDFTEYSQNFNLKQWGVLWLVTPLALTGVASRVAPQRRAIAWLSVAALGMAQLLTLPLPGARLIGLGIATSLMLVNTRYLQLLPVAVITIGFGLSFTGVLLWDGVPGIPQVSASGWCLVGAIAIFSLWVLRGGLINRPGTLAAIYAQATNNWAIALCILELVLLTVHSLGVYWQLISPSVVVLIATALLMGAIAYRSWQHPNNWAFYGLGWGLELLSIHALGFIPHSVINLAIVNLALGMLTQLLGDAWRWRHRGETVPSSLHILPLLYAGLSVMLRWGTFNSQTGWYSLGVAAIAISIGRRQQEFKPLVYLGMLGISISASEILLNRIQAPGISFKTQLIAIAALGTGIVYVYRLFSPWLSNYLKLTTTKLKLFAHFHWAASSSCLLLAATIDINANFLGLGTGIFLIIYAIFQGRHNLNSQAEEIWVYLGLLEIFGIRNYWLNTLLGHLFTGPLLPWLAAIACVGGYFLYILPWQSWGWHLRPWQRTAMILPLLTIWQTTSVVHQVSLLIAAGFYIFIAQLKQQIRFTYISMALVDWAMWRWFSDLNLTDALWYITPIGLSLLYVAQFDPTLKLPQQKQIRHNLRLLATGIICVVALVIHQDTGIQPGILSLIAIFAGLTLRVRAFLYIGTATFLLNGFYQLVVLILHHPFYKWIIGLLVGISLIWIAANFEARRTQLSSLVRNWLTQLSTWD